MSIAEREQEHADARKATHGNERDGHAEFESFRAVDLVAAGLHFVRHGGVHPHRRQQQVLVVDAMLQCLAQQIRGVAALDDGRDQAPVIDALPEGCECGASRRTHPV